MKISSIICTSSLLLMSSFHSFAASPAKAFSYCDTGREWSSYGTSVKAKGPTHLLVNSSGVFRGDTGGTFTFGNLDFYVNESFYGNDRTDYAGDAYKTIPFNVKGIFSVSVVYDKIGRACSYVNVAVHDAPRINSSSLSGGSNITSTVASWIDPISKNGNTKSIIFSYRNLDYNSTQTYTVQSSSASTTKVFHPQYNGSYKVSVSVSDGTFAKGLTLGEVDYTGGQECRDCGNRN